MVSLNDLLVFAAAALLMVLTPGPNMVYLVSRAICQGRHAAVLSLMGVAAGFVAHMLAAALGLSALLIAVPIAYDVLKFAGAVYLLYLAWQAVRPGARSPFEAQHLPHDSPARLITIGFLTNLLNPKAVMLYLAIFPQFVSPDRGSVLVQSLVLGMTQITISIMVNLLIIVFAARLSAWFRLNPRFFVVQRWAMGGVLGALAVQLATEQRRPS